MRTARRTLVGSAAFGLVMVFGLAIGVISSPSSQAAPGGTLLTGTVSSGSGEKMSGVVVSAEAAGKLIITSVYTDEQGQYYFPAMDGGAYNVWAQAVGYGTGKSQVSLSGGVR